MRTPFRILLKSAIVLAFAANVQAQGIPERVSALESAVATQATQIADLRSRLNRLREAYLEHQLHESAYVTSVDCSAGGSIMDILNDRRGSLRPRSKSPSPALVTRTSPSGAIAWRFMAPSPAQ